MVSTLLKKILRKAKHLSKQAIFGNVSSQRNPLVAHPWDLPEAIFYQLLKKEKKNSLSLAIIGAHHGYELSRLAKFPAVDKVYAFEPSPINHKKLKENLKRYFPKKHLFSDIAISDSTGTINFYENNLPGTGSILKVGKLSENSYGMRTIEAFECNTTSLDDFFAANLSSKLALWIDVQGAEMKVLRGATKTLKLVDYIFIEVSVVEETYKGGCTFNEITEFLSSFNFSCTQLGTDILNGTGNALFVRTTTFDY